MQPYLSWFISHVAYRKKFFGAVIIGIIIHMSVRLVIPFALGEIVDKIAQGNLGLISTYALIILFSGIIAEAFDLGMSACNEVLAQTVEKNTRIEFFNSMTLKRMTFHDQAKVGNLMALATNDIRMMNLTVSPGFRLLGEPVVAVTGVLLLSLFIHPIAGLFLIITFPFFFLSVFWYHKRSKPVSVLQQTQFRGMNAFLQEKIQGNRVIRGFTGENHENNSFRKINNELATTKIRRNFLLGFYTPALVLTAITGVMFIISVYLTLEGELSIAELITLSSLMLYLRGPSLLINNALQMAQLGLAGAEQLYDLVNEEEYGEEEVSGLSLDIKGKVEFEKVSFEYILGKPVLKQITFIIHPGETIAILGPTGSGKTTLLKLLTRFYEVSSGRILIDDIPITNIALESLRSQIGVVEQEIFLFSTSIRDNIGYSQDDISDQEIERCAKLAQAHDFIINSPEKYDTIIGERGITLSGGQKQRLGLARAFLADPKILILDDSTSALDSETENEVALAIDRLQQNRTTFIISHRLATIRRADKIILLNSSGSIQAMGTHPELLKSSKEYRRIFRIKKN
ncbi:MAG: ABC transporter ATP-binding protein [Candidatus Hodarchaeales archaeon]|jgi:ATP-binding cassette subfamily B protein